MKRLLFICNVLILGLGLCFGQLKLPVDIPVGGSEIAFYIKIPDNRNVPRVLSKSPTGLALRHPNTSIQRIFNKYNVSEFIEAFPNAKSPELQNVYYIRVNNKELVNEISRVHPGMITHKEEVAKVNYLLETNDYGLAWNGQQKNLDLINAKSAWDFSTGNPNVLVGISDLPIKTNHEDLIGKVVGYTNTTTFASHGTEVAGVVAANTNNGIGLSAIGYNIKLLYGYYDAHNYNTGLPNMWSLYQAGVKVINGSWYTPTACNNSPSSIDQAAINEMYNNGTVIVFAAGNTSTCGNSKDNPIYPASYDNVISVTSVGILDVGTTYNGLNVHWRDRVENIVGDASTTHHLNRKVDLAAPGFAIPVLANYNGQNYRAVWGTSSAAPHISGTVGLMISENASLPPKEIESILKLTSSNLDSISENANYIDKMGAGRLDASKAVEMAYKMAQPQSFIELKNRDFYRDWDFEIKTAPYGIKISNQKFRDSLTINLVARNYIEVKNTILKPNNHGSTVLSIDPSIPIPTQNNTESENLLGESKVNVMPQFDNSMYTLEYFLKNGVREDLDLTHHNGEGGRAIPTLVLKYNAAIETIEGQLNGYCNQSSIKYKYKGNYFEVIDRGATTLSDCGGDEETEFFTPLSGNIYMQKPSQKVYYEIVGNNELHLWVTQNHKLVFSKKALTIGEESVEKMISIYPNPAKKYVRIESTSSAIMSIEVYNIIGKRVPMTSNFIDKNQLDVSKLSRGVYFLKIHTKRGSVTKKLVLE